MLIFDFCACDGDIINKIIVKSVTLPTANKGMENAVYQYVGETNETYTHGYIYECVESISSDAIIYLEPHKIAFDEGSLINFFETAGDTFHQAVSGRFKYLGAGDIWNINGLDKDGNVVFEDYQLYTQDLEDAGFVFIVPMTDISDEEEVIYDLTYRNYHSYNWVRIDVQPSIVNPEGVATVDTPDGTEKDAVVNVQYVDNVVGTIETTLETV